MFSLFRRTAAEVAESSLKGKNKAKKQRRRRSKKRLR